MASACSPKFEPADISTLRSITAFRKDDSNTPIDFDALPAVDVDVPGFYGNQQTSQELQLLYNRGAAQRPARRLLSRRQRRDDLRRAPARRRHRADLRRCRHRDLRVLRATSPTISHRSVEPVAGRPLHLGRAQLGDRPRRLSRRRRLALLRRHRRADRATSPTSTARRISRVHAARLDQLPADPGSHTIYASYSRGFKGGGFDPRGVTTACRNPAGARLQRRSEIYDFMSFDPETVTSYELGWRAQLFDRRLRFSLNAVPRRL